MWSVCHKTENFRGKVLSSVSMTAVDHVFLFFQGEELAHSRQLTDLHFGFFHFLFGYFLFCITEPQQLAYVKINLII